jgi:hypothetical protein
MQNGASSLDIVRIRFFLQKTQILRESHVYRVDPRVGSRIRGGWNHPVSCPCRSHCERHVRCAWIEFTVREVSPSAACTRKSRVETRRNDPAHTAYWCNTNLVTPFALRWIFGRGAVLFLKLTRNGSGLLLASNLYQFLLHLNS